MEASNTTGFAQYCQAIYELDEDEIAVIQARIAERLEVSRPAVSEMIRRLEVAGLTTTRGTRIFLTRAGKRLAEQVVRRHRLAERFLTDILKVSWADAHPEAERWSNVISDVVEEAMVAVLGDPTTCPHGNPIPGTDYHEAVGTQAMSVVPVGVEFTVTRIPEELEFTPGLLEFLEDCRIVPGQRGTVDGRSPDGTLTVHISGRSIGIGDFASSRILVNVG